MHSAVEGHQLAVEEGEEAGLRPLVREPGAARGHQGPGGRVGGLGRVVEEQLVEAVEDVGHLVPLPGEEPEPRPGETDHHGRLGPFALYVAEGEAPAAVPGGEEIVEVPAGSALVARLVDERAAYAGDLGDRPGQQPALQYAADGGLARVLPGRADGERDPAAEVLDEPGDLVGEAGLPGPADDQRAERSAARDQPERECRSAGRPCSQRLGGPRYGHGARAVRLGRFGRVLLQEPAQFLDAVLAAVPDAGEPWPADDTPVGAARGLVLQPHRAPVGEPRYEQLPGERGDQVLVELSGEQVGGLGEEGEDAAAAPVLVLHAAPGCGGEDLGGPLPAPQRVFAVVRLGLLLDGRGPVDGQACPHGLDAGAVGDAPGVGERGDQVQAPPVLDGVVRLLGPVFTHDARGVVVGDLYDEDA